MRKVTSAHQTTIHLMQAMDAQRAVTIRYVKDNGQVSRRTVEVHSIQLVESTGNVNIWGYDRRTGEFRSFTVANITHYTLHRVAKLADYRFAVIPTSEQAIEDEEFGVVGFISWTSAFTLAA